MTATAAVPQQHTDPGDLDTLVGALRTQIDDLDHTLLRLVQERRALSRRIQSARVAAGGVRVELSRERAVLDTYARALGAGGTALATAVLRSCRGSL
jgi:chorismate mutase